MPHIALTLGSPTGTSDVWIQEGVLTQFGEKLPTSIGQRRAVVVTDSNVGPLYGEVVLGALRGAGMAADLFSVAAGEASKSLITVESIYEFLEKTEIGRDSFVVALGGGVVGDLAGFAAGTWMRGIPWVNCPTTLEAAVDSAIGGKTGVNFGRVKNLVGVFHQPCAVFVDPECLRTLSARDIRAGLAECIKHALLTSDAEVRWLEANAGRIVAGDVAAQTELIERNLRIKAGFVASDPLDRTGARAVLNLGHTIGHAIEGVAHGELRHGESVSLGLVAACRISQRMGMLVQDDMERVERLLSLVGLPTRLAPALNRERVFETMRLDKKNVEGKLRFVLLDGIGRPIIRDDVSSEFVIDAIDSVCVH